MSDDEREDTDEKEGKSSEEALAEIDEKYDLSRCEEVKNWVVR